MNHGELTQATLEMIKASQAKENDALTKSVSTATGLVAYDLQAPAKNLYPVNTPIRNVLPRTPGGVGTATNWKVIQQVTGSGFDAMGWVAEGQRTGRMSYSAIDKAAAYRTIGEEDQVTFEAVSAGRTFEDVRATAAMRVLQKMMLKEENALTFGNATLNLGTPVTPTVSASGSGATLPAATYSVIVVALTGEGYRGASLTNGIPTSQTITGADGNTYSLNGGSSNKSAAATSAVTLGQTLFASTTSVTGALGYAWFVGTAGNEKLEAITSINSMAINKPLLGTGQTAASVAATDKSSNPTLAFDGLFTTAFKSGSGSYINTLATGTAGTGSFLTSSGRGSVVEIDNAMQNMWDNYQVSPSIIFVNSQELRNITNKVLSSGSAPLLQYFADPAQGAKVVAAGGAIEYYYNPFVMGTGVKIPIMIHPAIPAGTIIMWAKDLPSQYQSNNVPNVAEVKTRKDYYQIDWPLRTRANEFGVYAEEVLAVYAPFAIGVINNVGNG